MTSDDDRARHRAYHERLTRRWFGYGSRWHRRQVRRRMWGNAKKPPTPRS